MERERPPENQIDTIRLSDYTSLPSEVNEWLQMQEVLPPSITEKLRKMAPTATLHEFLAEARNLLQAKPFDDHSYARDFEDARFTSLTEIIERNLNACGAQTHLFGTALRTIGVPVKYIHGNLERQKDDPEARHAWLQVYQPQDNTWFDVDPTGKDFTPHGDRLPQKTYHDWKELKGDFEKGEY